MRTELEPISITPKRSIDPEETFSLKLNLKKSDKLVPKTATIVKVSNQLPFISQLINISITC